MSEQLYICVECGHARSPEDMKNGEGCPACYTMESHDPIDVCDDCFGGVTTWDELCVKCKVKSISVVFLGEK